MTCFKYRADEDPVAGTADERFLSGVWSDRRIGRPETSTIGLTFTHGGYSRYGLGVPRASGAFTVHRPEHWAFEGTDLHYGDALGLADAIVAYEVDGVELTTGADGLPVPTHADGAPESLEVLATAPARLWAQDEQPSRYAHEPGELENTAMAVFGDALARAGAPRDEQPRVRRRVLGAGRRHGLQRRRDGLDLRTGATRPSTGSPATCSTGWARRRPSSAARSRAAAASPPRRRSGSWRARRRRRPRR